MSAPPGTISDLRAYLDSKAGLRTMVLLHSAVTCLSLIEVATFQLSIDFNPGRLWIAVIVAIGFSAVSLLFVSARFCFGDFVGFYFYTMILGFLWIDVFSEYSYPHLLAGVSAAASLLLFLMPVLLIRAPLRPLVILSNDRFEQQLTFILAISVAVIAVAATYNWPGTPPVLRSHPTRRSSVSSATRRARTTDRPGSASPAYSRHPPAGSRERLRPAAAAPSPRCVRPA